MIKLVAFLNSKLLELLFEQIRVLRAYQSCTSGSGSTPLGRTCYHARHARGASILSLMLDMLDERALRATSISLGI